jgi:ATP-dependent helicase/nuclease subunit B
MSVEIEWVRYGRPAAEALHSTISLAKGDEPLAPVSVVVPSNYVGVATRRLLAAGTLGSISTRGIGLAAVSFVTVYRLAELLGSHRLAGSGRRPVSTPVIAAALRAALDEDPGIFEPVAAHAATETALVAAYRELRDLSDDALDALSGRSERAADVVRLHRVARSSLVTEFYDESDLLSAAAEVIGDDTSATAQLGTIVVFLPEVLSRHAGQLLGAVGASSKLIVLAGTTGHERADAEVDRSVSRIDNRARRTIPDTDLSLDCVDVDRTRIVTVSDCDEEVRAAVRHIVDAARAGTPLDRIAILHASPHPYARLVHEQLTEAGIAFNGAAVMALTARLVGRTLLGLLALPDGGFRREEFFAWLAGGPMRHDGQAVPVVAWERLSREAGIVAGRVDWDQRLTVLADERIERAEQLLREPDAPPWRAENLRQEATQARALQQFALGLIDTVVGAAEQPQPWSKRVDWTRALLTRLLGDERRRSAWPLVEQKAAERVDRALDRLSSLDTLESSVSQAVFARSLALELEADLGRVGRMGEGVLVGSVDMGVGLDLDLVIVLGLAEGIFPAPLQDDSLLPDLERVATGDELPLRAQRIERQHRQLFAALAGAAHQVLSVPRGDLRRNVERVPSRWILQVASAMAGERWWSEDFSKATLDWLTHVASFDAGIRHMQFPANEQEHRLRSLMAQGSSHLPLLVLLAADEVVGSGAEVLMARRSERFTRFDANLSGLGVPSPAEEVMSATRLENWATCPFAYFMHNILKVDEVENPEVELRITPLVKGSLVHKVLELFIQEMMQQAESGQVDLGSPWSATHRLRLLQIGEEECQKIQAKGRTGRPIFWRQDKKRIMADLEGFLESDSNFRLATRTQPLAVELAFGLPKATVGTVALALPDGRSVHFRGLADRVDRDAEGTLYVVDYKTGKADAYKGLSEENPDDRGHRLQLAVYGQAARLSHGTPTANVRADYWFVSGQGRFDRIGYSVTPAVLQHVGETIGAMVGGIEAGCFPSYPSKNEATPWVECAFCDPDGMGVAELRRQFNRKQVDPAMRPFVGFVIPDEPESNDSEVHG